MEWRDFSMVESELFDKLGELVAIEGWSVIAFDYA